MSRTWLITAASRGLGRAFAEAALGAGDSVAATARVPRRAAEALLGLVGMPEPPIRLLLGNMTFDNVTAARRRQLGEWERLEELARSADG